MMNSAQSKQHFQSVPGFRLGSGLSGLHCTGVWFFIAWCVFGAARGARADQVDNYVRAEMQKQHIPGLSLAVVRGSKTLKIQGYGLSNVELRAAASPSTVYHLASLTKQFTAAAVLLLVQDGKISLDDKISRYLADTPDTWRDVTIRQLLTHTSGIKDELNEMRGTTVNGTSAAEIASILAKYPLNFLPGTQWSYSNSGYLLLGIIIQKVSGKSYGQFLAERLFHPLGMSATRLYDLDALIPGRAAGYMWREGRLHNSPYVHPTLADNADAGLVTSAVDMARWAAVLNTGRLLTHASWTQAWSPVLLADGSHYAYGFGWERDKVNGHPVVQHSGAFPDCSTFIVHYLDDDLTVVVLCNLSRANPVRIAHHIAGFYIPALLPVPLVDREPQVTDRVRAALLQAQAGTLTANAFTPQEWAKVHPDTAEDLMHFLRPLGALKSLALLSRRDQEGKRDYSYLATFTADSVKFDVTLTKEGRISGLGIGSG